MLRTLLSFGAVLLPSLLMAQQDSVTYLKDRQLEAVEVVGQRRQQRLSSASPLQELTQADLRIQGVTDIADALHRLPGVTLRDYGGAGGMKTVSVRGFGAQHTAVIYDGIALSDCQSGQIDLARYSLDNVESVSLVVGDQDEIFIPAREVSTAATLTIRTFQTPDDDLRSHLTAQLRTGSFGYVNPFVRFSRNISNRFGIQALGEFIHVKNDYPFTLKNVTIETRERRQNNRMNSGHAEVNFAWSPSSTSQLEGKVYYYDNDRQLPGMVRYYTNNSQETERDRNAFGQVAFRTSNGQNLWFSSRAKYNWASTRYRDPSYPDGVMDQDYWQREFYATASLLFKPAKSFAVDYSADFIHNNLNSSEPGDTKPYRNTILQSLTAKYQHRGLKAILRGLYTISLNGAKLGEGGHDFHRFSPSVSLSYQLSARPLLHVRASYKNIFRVPNFTELYFRHYGSKDLQPENTDQLNVGATWQQDYCASGRFTLTLDGYLNHIKDKIVAVPFSMFMWSNINMGKVRTLGADITLCVEQRLNARHRL
ncbi:MAG: TonB-dependent receptor, partial [Bacteroidaceae bacterium]|nr:TonB-dependent receptor [Bacteroidaceae bacterium]